MRFVLAALVVAGCYHPSFQDCTVACATASDCASSQVCGADRMCVSPSFAGRCAAVSVMIDADDSPSGDAPPHDAGAHDAPPHDATPVDSRGDDDCTASCPGTCQGATCVIDCSAKGACPDAVTCPAGIACRVTCGNDDCKTVDCTQASSCDLVCSGPNSCKTVRCGSGPCDVTCSGKSSCEMTDCHQSCACEVDCTGDKACMPPAMCPAGCNAGKGCTSQGGCDRC